VASPEALAILSVESGARWTYGDLDREAERWAALLATRCGVRAGDRVAVLSYNRPEVFAMLFGAARLGATLVPFNWRLSAKELLEIAGDARPRALIYEAAFEDVAAGLEAEARVLLGAEPEVVAEVVGSSDRVDFDDEQIAMMLYTSGTTGRPKGVMIPWRQVLTNAMNTTLSCDLRDADRCLAFLPLFHTGGMNCLATPLLWRGGAVVLTPRFDAEESLRLIDEHAITAVIAVPTMYEMLEAAGALEKPPGSLRQILCGGAPCPDSLIARYHDAGLALRQGYGLTEAGPNLFTLSATEGARRFGTVGRPAVHGEIALLSDEGSFVEEPHEVGEIVVRGPHVMAGYFELPEVTAKTLEGGWLRTGDYATRDEEGWFAIAGRKKEMFISGGENVYPAEVERVLLDHPAIHEAAVVGVPDERWGQVGLAVVVADGELEPEALRAWVKERLASYKTPRHVRVVDALPQTSSGKVAKTKLADLLT